MKSSYFLAGSILTFAALLAPTVAKACVFEIGFTEYNDKSKNKAACEASLNRILYETQAAINAANPTDAATVSIQKENDGLQFGHPKSENFMSCEQTHTFHPLSYYVELGIVGAGDTQQLQSGTYCDLAEKRIDALNLGKDGADRSVPDSSARSVPDNTSGTLQKGSNSDSGK